MEKTNDPNPASTQLPDFYVLEGVDLEQVDIVENYLCGKERTCCHANKEDKNVV